MKLEDVVNYGNATQVKFDAYKAAIVAINSDLADTWEADVLIPQIAAVSSMLATLNIRRLNKADTASRNMWMDNETPLLAVLETKIKLCIGDGSITDGLGSFGLGVFNASISHYDIAGFHSAYTATIARVLIPANKAALIARGFTALNITAITTNHDKAWGFNIVKIGLKVTINTLSVDNKLLVTTMLGSCQLVINGGKTHAKSIGDKVLAKSFTQRAILSSVSPTPVKKARRRKVGATASVIIFRKLPGNHTVVATNVSKFPIALGRSLTIEGVPSATMMLLPGVPVSILKKDIPGEGEFIKLINAGLVNGVVTILVIVP
jgi:hypothetical protein